MRLLLAAGVLAAALLGRRAVAYPYPAKIHGVNLGSWLLLEAWMLPQGVSIDSAGCCSRLAHDSLCEEWADMGGENNCDCSTCIGTEL